MIEIKKYYPPKNTDFIGNPLCTFLPPVSPEVMGQIMASRVNYDPNRRIQEGHLRIQYVLQLMNYYVPLPEQSRFGTNLLSLTLEGYRYKNPLRPDSTTTFAALCQSISEGQSPPEDKGRNLNEKWCVLLIGTPGTGKSTTASSALHTICPELLHHVQHGQLYQKLSIWVELTGAGSNRSLAQLVFDELSRAAEETGHFVPKVSSRATETEYRLAIRVLAQRLNVGILVLNELQHLCHKGKTDESSMRFLTSLINELKIPILMIGTWACLPLLQKEGRLARRAFSPVSAYFRRMQQGKLWNGFVNGLFRLQYLKNLAEAKDFYDELYLHTQGVHDIAVKFFVLCQLEAIADKSELLTPTLMQRVSAAHMDVLAPWIRQMRDGHSEEDPLIYDSEPVDLAEYVKRFAGVASLQEKRSRCRENVSPETSTDGIFSIAEALVHAGVCDHEAALVTANDAVARAPKRSVAEHVKDAIQASAPRGPKPTRSKKPERKNREADSFNALAHGDFRKVSYLAVKEGRNLDSAFRKAGLLCNVTDDIEF